MASVESKSDRIRWLRGSYETGDAWHLVIAMTCLCLALHVAFFGLLLSTAPSSVVENWLFAEDRVVETATAAAFLAAALLAAFALPKMQDFSYQDRLFVMAIGALGLVGFLDEMSFGERLFGWEPGQIMGVKIDGAHDFAQVANNLRRELFGTLSPVGKAVFLLGAAALLGSVGWLAKSVLGRRNGAAARWATAPVMVLLALFVGELALSTLIDIDAIEFVGAYTIEEIAEMNAAILLSGLVAAVSRPRGSFGSSRRRGSTGQ